MRRLRTTSSLDGGKAGKIVGATARLSKKPGRQIAQPRSKHQLATRANESAMPLIYLDHNSTTSLLDEVAAAMAEWQSVRFGNPSSQHQIGRRAHAALEDARGNRSHAWCGSQADSQTG